MNLNFTLKVQHYQAVKQFSFLRWLLTVILINTTLYGFAQVSAPVDSLKANSLGKNHQKIYKPKDNVYGQYDFGNLTRAIFNPKKKADSLHKGSGFTIVPNVAANPTIGEQLGIKAVAGLKLGGDPNTLLSVGATSATVTTKGIIFFYVNHNIFTPGNKFNIQGNLVFSKTVAPDYGFGIGRNIGGESKTLETLSDPTRKVDAIHSLFFTGREKVYKQVAKGLFVGAGLEFDVRGNIKNADTVKNGSPYSIYNIQHGFPQDHYSANGFLFNVEYTTRDNQNRAYKGIYFDAGIRANETFIGSTKNSMQLTTDFRKYFSLSSVNPEEVLAFWNWGSYLLNGAIPYLELPGTARDGAFRSGRGYTTQYFKGTEFNDTEAEFRFPILANKFISGVAFASMQTANDEQGTKLFQVFQPGAGAGLRVLFNKVTRTNLALDYAYGKFGNRGFFLNLNEAF